MSTVTVELPESLKKAIEALAAKEGFSLSQIPRQCRWQKIGGYDDNGLSVPGSRCRTPAGLREVSGGIAGCAADAG
jgi:hypothetical protein